MVQRVPGRARVPWLAEPYPLGEYLDSLKGDYGKIARALLRHANAQRGEVDGIALDAGEVLYHERSEFLSAVRLDREVTPVGRRSLVRRVVEQLEYDGWATKRPARGTAQAFGPTKGPRRGPSPSVLRFLRFRAIMWPKADDAAQTSTQDPAQPGGPILPVTRPGPAVSPSPDLTSRSIRFSARGEACAPPELSSDLRFVKEELESRCGTPLTMGSNAEERAFTVQAFDGWIRRFTTGPRPQGTHAIVERCERFMRNKPKPITSLHYLALAYRDGRIGTTRREGRRAGAELAAEYEDAYKRDQAAWLAEAGRGQRRPPF